MVDVNDRLEQYYLEKLWELIPPIYRDADGIEGEGGGVLRGLVGVLAEQAAIERRSADRLWDDQFVDLSDDWAVPYIGDLLATRMVSALDTRGRRVDVANTLYYRRRAGTLAVLEGLTADLTGWEGTVVEEFRRLLRHPHGLDPGPAATGRVTQTPAHGLPDLRSPRGAQTAWGPFDEYSYLPDVRKNVGGLDGRFGITKLALHLYRLQAFRVTRVTPRLLAADSNGKVRFTFDPSGRANPLFQRHSRPNFEFEWRAAREWELPAPMRCEVLAHSEFEITEARILDWAAPSPPAPNPPAITTAQADTLRTIRGLRFRSESRFRTRLEALFSPALGTAARHRLLREALVDDCGKGLLMRDGAASGTGDISSVAVEELVSAVLTAVPRELTQAGNLLAGVLAPDDKRLVVDAENGLGYFTAGTPPNGFTTSYCYGFSGPTGATSAPRVGLADVAASDRRRGGGALAAPAAASDTAIEIADSATYGPVANLPAQQSLVVQASDEQRPYLDLTGDWTFRATAPGSVLVVDGIWAGARSPRTIHLAASPNCSWAAVTIRHTTFDPGGADADGVDLGPITLSVDSTVTELSIESCIIGRIVVAAGGLVDTLTMSDSIVHTTKSTTPVAIRQPLGVLDIQRCTVIGRIDVHQIEASEVLCTETITVDDLQSGCIRFSAFAAGSEVPRAYRCVTLDDRRGLFASIRFGDPGYCQLSDVAASTIIRGGEDGTEIGAFNSLLNPIKLDSLRAKVDEFLPFGLIPMFITET